MVLGGGFDGALQQQSVQRCGDGIGLVLQIYFELRRTRLLHDRIDRQALHFGDFINVVDETLESIHFLELERHRRVQGRRRGPAESRA